MKLKRIMIAAPKSGSGKTTITCGLLAMLRARGAQVVSYKCGPDYIDPMYHKKVIGVPSKNLDTFFTGEEATTQIFLKDRTSEEFVVIEGVMGLFDGLGGIREEGSSYHLAKVTQTPIILVVDAKGMGRSVVALLAGFLAYDTKHLIQGVVLNRMSKAYYEIIGPVIEEELHISVVGYVPEHKKLQLQSRHLGLYLPRELEDMQKQLQLLTEALEKTVSIEEIVSIASNASTLKQTDKREPRQVEEKTTIAVAYDEAFCFYYDDNLQLLEDYGAKLAFFSPIHDSSLPEGSCGILLGGGYPELYADKLSANAQMKQAIKQAAIEGMPIVAECGGFMYLHETLIDGEKKEYPMVGVVKGKCYDTGKLVRFGYIELEEKMSKFLPAGEKIRGHEFHYFDSTANGEDCEARKPVTEKTYSCICAGENYWYGFPHLYYPSNPEFAKGFVKKAQERKNQVSRKNT